MKYSDEVYEELRRELLMSLENLEEVEDDSIRERIDELVIGRGSELHLSLMEKEELGNDLFYSLRRLDILEELEEDPEINEIMVNGPERIFYERAGELYRFEKNFSSPEKLEDLVQQIAGAVNRSVNEQSPIADARLKNGDRVNIVLPPVSLEGPIITIRKFPKRPITMEDLIEKGSISKEAAGELKTLVGACYTIIVSGGTSTGKTTFLNALSNYIPPKERIITIEDNAELQLQKTENLVRLESRSSLIGDEGDITIRDLIKAALRMRPNRIIVGEVRGEETFDFLNCLNTGHEGSLGTVHANSPRELIFRLESMVRMGIDLPIPVIRSQIASGIEIIVHLKRDRYGKRQVSEIAEVLGIKQNQVLMNTLYRQDEAGKLIKVGRLTNDGKRKSYENSEKKQGSNGID